LCGAALQRIVVALSMRHGADCDLSRHAYMAQPVSRALARAQLPCLGARTGLLVLALASFGSAAPVAESPHRRLWNHWRAGFPRIHQWLAHHGWTPPTEPIPTMGPTEQIPAGPPSSNPSKGFVGTVSSPPPSSPPWGPYVPPNLNCGSCQHNPRQDCRGDAFASCPQKYPFPRYYYSKFELTCAHSDLALPRPLTLLLSNLLSELFAKTASEFCKEAYTQTNGKGKKYDANTMGCDSATVSKRKAVCPLDAAEIFLYHCAQAAGWENCLEECNGALLLLSGEAVPVGCEGEVPTREDNNYHFYLPDPAVSNDNPGNVALPALIYTHSPLCAHTHTRAPSPRVGNIWQTDASAAIPVDESATKLLEQARSDCGKPGVEGSAEEHVPAGFISAGNPNWIGSFCHVSTQYDGGGHSYRTREAVLDCADGG